ncbi:DUF3291 domain-containing protein [Aurantimonas aggregata]|uniref:DUF3291 domain-containing protein n=1 Tax=Aurantimonas aggregata TaxID=2047720 RepID=A0A6L9ML01_9HYPH|nr:DUF3291 domain-containing protein [Aurantimonas aggregata]NDV88519.1 DUF3291 domain-containing protein [Aurantimonas aggregata]
MPHLALYNFNNFRVPSQESANRGFHDRNDVNFAAAELSEGFVARSGHPDEPGPESWGEQVYPRFHVENGDGWAPATLSLWRDLPALFAFSYAGIHAEALRNARQWFDRQAWPTYALWWVEEGHIPEWREGVDRLEHLHDHGPSPHAFDFKRSFDPAGNPTTVDHDAVKRCREANERAQARLVDTV